MLWNAGLKGLFGTNPFAFHAASLVLYAAITIEVWTLVRRLAGESRAWIAAVAFAIYPRHGESVAWITGSTDLTAASLVLAAVLCATARWRPAVRIASAGAFAALAGLSKEAAFVSPLLALLLLWSLRRKDRWLVPGAMALALVGVAVARYAVLGGLGGYTAYTWTAKRAVGSFGSYVLASVTPPDLELFRHWYFLLLPALVLVIAVARVWQLARRAEHERVRLAGIGALWFSVSLLPLLNIGVDLNNANGERLIFLGSVGLALSFAVLVDVHWLLGAVAAGTLALSLLSATDWLQAERISNRVLDSAVAVAPANAELVLLSSPENFRTAHVFPGGSIDAPLEWRGRGDLTSAVCSQLAVRQAHADAVSFTPVRDLDFLGKTTWQAPFDFPIFRSPSPLSGDCSYARRASGPPGLGLVAIVRATPSQGSPVYVFFDGYTLRRCC